MDPEKQHPADLSLSTRAAINIVVFAVLLWACGGSRSMPSPQSPGEARSEERFEEMEAQPEPAEAIESAMVESEPQRVCVSEAPEIRLRIPFGRNSASIGQQELGAIHQLAQLAGPEATMTFGIHGHAEPNESQPNELARSRAIAVRAKAIELGASPEHLQVVQSRSANSRERAVTFSLACSYGEGFCHACLEPNEPEGCTPPDPSLAHWEGDRLVFQPIAFRIDHAEIEQASFPILDAIAAALCERPSARVEIHRHTDDIHPDPPRAIMDAQQTQRRAEAVRAALIHRGIPPDRIVAIGQSRLCQREHCQSLRGRARRACAARARRTEIWTATAGVDPLSTPMCRY